MATESHLKKKLNDWCILEQVVRHERAGIKADMWSFGILIWELISGMDITDMQSLAITRQMKVV